MYAGRQVEQCPTASLFADPQHPYTLSLLGSLPQSGRQGERLYAIEGSVPSALLVMSGCRFAPRCQVARQDCMSTAPRLREVAMLHRAACHHAPLESVLVQGVRV